MMTGSGIRAVPRHRIEIIFMKQMPHCPAASQQADSGVSEKQTSGASRFNFLTRVNTGLQVYDDIAYLIVLGNNKTNY